MFLLPSVIVAGETLLFLLLVAVFVMLPARDNDAFVTVGIAAAKLVDVVAMLLPPAIPDRRNH